MAKALGMDTKDKKAVGIVSDTLSFGLMGLGTNTKKQMSPVNKKQQQD